MDLRSLVIYFHQKFREKSCYYKEKIREYQGIMLIIVV